MSGWTVAIIAAFAAAYGAGCGDNRAVPPDGAVPPADAAPDPLPLVASDRLIVVAHQDDDLLFMQPDLFEAVSAHRPITVVYVTAGDAASGVVYSENRNYALRFAYGTAGGSQNWTCAWIPIAGHQAQHCRLADANVSLVFLGYPDGGVPGNFPNSLLRLWDGLIPGARTVTREFAYYDRPGLIATVAEVITTTAPQQIWTQEIAATHSDDHSDHMLVGALTVLAAATANTTAQVISYRGYNVNYEPANMPEPLSVQTSLMMRAYEACQDGCGVCDVQPCDTLPDPRYNEFAHRRYAVAMRRPPMTGLLHTTTGCVAAATDGTFAIADCASASVFQFDPGGNVRIGSSCLAMTSDTTLSLGPCGAGPERAFAFDDEGHLWAGVPPIPSVGQDYDHGLCVANQGGHVSGALCGLDLNARWDLIQPPVATPRPSGLPAGRAVRLADITGDGKADLCAVEATGLMCAPGDGTGVFGKAIRIDSPAAPLAIDPPTLVLADVDGDGAIDACGNDTIGVVCATAASGFVAMPWTGALGSTISDAANEGSLGADAGSLCQLDASGFACVSRGANAAVVESTWPTQSETLWPADIDGDGQPDWCVSTADGPACGLASEQGVTNAGVGWGFSLASVVDDSVGADGSTVDLSHGALADVSGDGRADLCAAIGGNVECALSQGHGFGPRMVMLSLPAGDVATALWLGDLDGDGKADACVDDGTSITCARSP